MKNLDLLSPAAHRDLEALQSSGLENIHYSTFLDQVSRKHLSPDHGRTEGLAEELGGGVYYLITALHVPFTSPHVPGASSCWGCLHTMCLKPVLEPPSGLGGKERAPTQQHVSLFMVLNPLLWTVCWWEEASSMGYTRGCLIFSPSILMGNA